MYFHLKTLQTRSTNMYQFAIEIRFRLETEINLFSTFLFPFKTTNCDIAR